MAPPGGELIELSVLFVDVRGFTALSEQMPANEAVGQLNRFYNLSAETVFALEGTLDKMVGDQVMAFFGAPFRPEDHQKRAVEAALTIVAGMDAMLPDGNAFSVGGAVASGMMFMGNVGEGEVRDFTVIGDVVNTAARLQAEAMAGEVLVTEDTYQAMAPHTQDSPIRVLELRGKEAPVQVRVLRDLPV